MKKIGRNNLSLNWLGRWIDDNGKFSGWGGSTLQFKFTGTSLSLEIDANSSGSISAMIDDYSADWTQQIKVEKNGVSIVSIASNIGNKEHTAFLRFTSKDIKGKGKGNSYIKVKSILIDDTAVIKKWSGSIKIGWFGDSWASAGNDITRYLGIDNAEIHSISETGYTALHGLVRYPFVVGKIPVRDEMFDAVVISYGVNDSNNKILKYNILFKIIIKILVRKIRSLNPNVCIFFIQSPRNYSISKDYSRLGKTLKDVSDKYKKSVYISSNGIEKKLTWQKDGAHLDINGKHVYGNWLGKKLSDYLSKI